jgi:large repetitive protein
MLDKDNRLSEEAMNSNFGISDAAPLASRSIGGGDGGQGVIGDTAPTILGFSPQSGRLGDLITITGSNLGSIISVTFNGVPASDFTPVRTFLKAIVPSRATTGPIQVIGPTGEATSLGSFTVMQGAPSIIDIVPSSGPPGTAVTIFGMHLEGTNRVTFNGVDASSFPVRSPEQVQATAPAGATTGPLRVSGPGGSAMSTINFTISQDVVPPSVRVTAPNGGERFQPGQQVMIQWQSSDNMGVVAHNVQFSADGGGTFSDIVINLPGSAQSFSWTVPNRPTTQGVIQVVVRDAAGNQSSDRSDSVFTIAISTSSAPTIASFSPMSGLPGTVVTISGTNFSVADLVDLSVLFNVTEAAVGSASATSIVAAVPLGATTGTLKVTTPAGTATSTSPFTVTTPAPAISSFSPLSGRPGDLVNITGTGLSEIEIVRFNGVQAPFTLESDTSIAATVPSGATTGPIEFFSRTRTVKSASNFTVLTEVSTADLAVVIENLVSLITSSARNSEQL